MIQLKIMLNVFVRVVCLILLSIQMVLLSEISVLCEYLEKLIGDF
jgi:hypothetical protein